MQGTTPSRASSSIPFTTNSTVPTQTSNFTQRNIERLPPAVVTFGSKQYEPQEQQETARRVARRLGPEYLSQRTGPGGSKVQYIEGWKILSLANDVFGFNGWSSTIVESNIDYLDEANGRFNVGVSCLVRITVKDGAFREDIGYGSSDNVKGKGAAIEKAKKEAVTDGLKRSLRQFGECLGNCTYDKDYLKQLSKIKVPPPPSVKIENLHRAPEFRTPQRTDLRASAELDNKSSNSSSTNGNACLQQQNRRAEHDHTAHALDPHRQNQNHPQQYLAQQNQVPVRQELDDVGFLNSEDSFGDNDDLYLAQSIELDRVENAGRPVGRDGSDTRKHTSASPSALPGHVYSTPNKGADIKTPHTAWNTGPDGTNTRIFSPLAKTHASNSPSTSMCPPPVTPTRTYSMLPPTPVETPVSPRSKKSTAAPNTVPYQHDNSPAPVLPANSEKSPRRIARAQTCVPGNSTSDTGRWLFGDQNPSNKPPVTLQNPTNDANATKQLGNHIQKHQQETFQHVNIQTISNHDFVPGNLQASHHLQAQSVAGDGNQANFKGQRYNSESKHDGLKPENIGSAHPTYKTYESNTHLAKSPMGEALPYNASVPSRSENHPPGNIENPPSVYSKPASSRPLRPYNQNSPGLNHQRPGSVGMNARTPLVQGKFVPNPSSSLKPAAKDIKSGEIMPPQKRARGEDM